jgi:hypothetical protein
MVLLLNSSQHMSNDCFSTVFVLLHRTWILNLKKEAIQNLRSTKRSVFSTSLSEHRNECVILYTIHKQQGLQYIHAVHAMHVYVYTVHIS